LHYKSLPQPQGDLAMAKAFAAAGDAVSAAIYFQRVYYGHPLSADAAEAGTESARLREALGENYPPAMPSAMLGRAFRLLESRQGARARKELEALVSQLGGAERDLARVRIGVAQYNAEETAAARRYLAGLAVESPEADAERLFYLVQCARRLGDKADAEDLLGRLARLHPDSRWRREALVAIANNFLIAHQPESFEPLYQACYDSFTPDPDAALCHWKVAWNEYLRRDGDAASRLREHLKLFPASENAQTALYFLGRLAEQSGDAAAARAYYDELVREYPNRFYAGLARERLSGIRAARPSPAVTEFLGGVSFPRRARTLDFAPDAVSLSRIERARLLASAGLSNWAETELAFGARSDGQSHVLALELARVTSSRKPDQALRYIKAYANGYLSIPFDSAPLDFWKQAFPLPFRTDLERFSRQYSLDPFLMAALIRQESEFDTRAVSVANARGLTQIKPSTGRDLSRMLKIRPYSTAVLFQPSVNLQMGTYYLRTVTNQLGGHVEAALAAYNAGLSRARVWLTWGEFREPAEFIETVPLTETRDYIKTVLRNADVYRRVYGSGERAASDAR
jgi:soluble lytic murein transglycosylase